MTATFETQGLVEQLDPAALAAAVAAHEPASSDAPEPIKRSSRTSVMALSVCALAINGAAAIYTWPSGLPSLNLSSLADLLPRQEASAPKPDPVVAALKDIQSTQQQHTASLQESNQALQQNAAVLQADSMVLLSLRQSITDERVDVKKVSSQLSTLIAKIESLQSAMMSEMTSSIPRGRTRNRSTMRKRMAPQSKSMGPVSVGGAPLSVPATISAPDS
jgi:hypothetical protein